MRLEPEFSQIGGRRHGNGKQNCKLRMEQGGPEGLNDDLRVFITMFDFDFGIFLL